MHRPSDHRWRIPPELDGVYMRNGGTALSRSRRRPRLRGSWHGSTACALRGGSRGVVPHAAIALLGTSLSLPRRVVSFPSCPPVTHALTARRTAKRAVFASAMRCFALVENSLPFSVTPEASRTGRAVRFAGQLRTTMTAHPKVERWRRGELHVFWHGPCGRLLSASRVTGRPTVMAHPENPHPRTDHDGNDFRRENHGRAT